MCIVYTYPIHVPYTHTLYIYTNPIQCIVYTYPIHIPYTCTLYTYPVLPRTCIICNAHALEPCTSMSYLFNVHALELYTSSSLTCDLDLYTLLLIHATHNQRLCPIHYQHQCHDCSSLRCSFYVDLSDLALIFNILLSNLLPSALADLQGMQDGSSPANVKLQLLQYSTSINGDQESN